LLKDPFHIDVVISWVDGKATKHEKKIQSYIDKEVINNSHGIKKTRFKSINEIEYCVLSILKFAPFVKNIFIVTDNQDPKIFNAVKTNFPERFTNIKIIDHKEIFENYERFLPVFNSRSIESMIWRIKDLSNNFVYFNDDFFIIRPIKISDWFINGNPVLRGNWKLAPKKQIKWIALSEKIRNYFSKEKKYSPKPNFYISQWKAAKIIGFDNKFFRIEHTPHAINRKRLDFFFKKNKTLLEKNISYRFRNYSQFNTVALSNHLEIKKGNSNLEPPKAVYIYPIKRHKNYIKNKLEQCDKDLEMKFLCVQSLDRSTIQDQQKIMSWIKKRIFKK